MDNLCELVYSGWAESSLLEKDVQEFNYCYGWLMKRLEEERSDPNEKVSLGR